MNCRNKDVTALFFFVFYQRSRTLIGQNRAVGGPMRSRFVMQISRPTIDAGLFYYYYYFLKNRLPIQSIRLTDDLHVSTTSSVTWLNYFLGGNFHFNQGKKKKKKEEISSTGNGTWRVVSGDLLIFFFLPLFPFSFFLSPKKWRRWRGSCNGFLLSLPLLRLLLLLLLLLRCCVADLEGFDSIRSAGQLRKTGQGRNGRRELRESSTVAQSKMAALRWLVFPMILIIKKSDWLPLAALTRSSRAAGSAIEIEIEKANRRRRCGHVATLPHVFFYSAGWFGVFGLLAGEKNNQKNLLETNILLSNW